MHEMSLVEAIMDSLLPICDERGWRKVERVVLKVGALRQVMPDALVFCFETTAVGTPLEGAALEIVDVPILQKCAKCGLEWGGEVPLGRCPRCGSIEVETIAGTELDIESLEVGIDGD
jgi:hydrogenase nickel incorporation protein HypA/HybF